MKDKNGHDAISIVPELNLLLGMNKQEISQRSQHLRQ